MAVGSCLCCCVVVTAERVGVDVTADQRQVLRALVDRAVRDRIVRCDGVERRLERMRRHPVVDDMRKVQKIAERGGSMT